MSAAPSSPAPAFQAETDGIRITVRPEFLEGDSDPGAGKFVWGYEIDIDNLRADPIQLLRRTWRISGGDGRQQTVKGDGVVGEQPIIAPGARFTYASGVPLSAPFGVMDGAYHMVDGSGRAFDVVIPLFALDSPYARRAQN